MLETQNLNTAFNFKKFDLFRKKYLILFFESSILHSHIIDGIFETFKEFKHSGLGLLEKKSLM